MNTSPNIVSLPTPDRFEEFWKVYPRKVRKALARAKFEAITGEGLETKTLDRDSGEYVPIFLKADADTLIEAARRYRKSNIDPHTFDMKDDGKFMCHPATWLNQGRWEAYE